MKRLSTYATIEIVTFGAVCSGRHAEISFFSVHSGCENSSV